MTKALEQSKEAYRHYNLEHTHVLCDYYTGDTTFFSWIWEEGGNTFLIKGWKSRNDKEVTHTRTRLNERELKALKEYLNSRSDI